VSWSIVPHIGWFAFLEFIRIADRRKVTQS
jgi:hypothetical protein